MIPAMALANPDRVDRTSTEGVHPARANNRVRWESSCASCCGSIPPDRASMKRTVVQDLDQDRFELLSPPTGSQRSTLIVMPRGR
jgi:hypothetical protein